MTHFESTMDSSLRKAAVLLTTLPEEEAASILSLLSESEVETVAIEIAKLGKVSHEEQLGTIDAFVETSPFASMGEGGLDVVRSLVEKALGEEGAQTLDNVRQSVQSIPFGFLRRVDPQNVLTFMIDEHPQTTALILSHLPPSYGAEIIAALPLEKQVSVARRIATMEQTSPEVIRLVEKGLENRISSVMGQSYNKAGGIASIAEILNVTDRGAERALLENLGQEDPELVENIRRKMFVFDDLVKLGDKDIQAILKNVETAQWAMSLKGTSPELKEKILGNMSQRAGTLLTEEMEFLGSVRLSEVEVIQQQIVDIIRRLEDIGEINLHQAEDTDQFIQ